MIATLFALLGFGPSEVQAKVPPALGWVGLSFLALFPALAIEGLVRFIGWVSFGYLPEWVISVAFRTVGVFGVAVWLQAFVRVAFYHDDHSWAGWIRKIALPLLNR